ncbi:MAG: hypothetical protein Tsb002_10990 [Wenzhouxiangellaceae bacterium]
MTQQKNRSSTASGTHDDVLERAGHLNMTSFLIEHERPRNPEFGDNLRLANGSDGTWWARP